MKLPKAAGFRDTVRFTIDYRGKITQGRGLYFFKAEPGRPHRPQQIYSGGGTDGNPNWIPTYGPPHDKATWEMIATVPAGYTVVSNGRLLSDKPNPAPRGAPAKRRDPHGALDSGEAGIDLPDLDRGGSAEQDQRPVAGCAARVLRLSRGRRRWLGGCSA